MTKSEPPVLPEKRLERVLGVARTNALGVLIVAGASLLLCVGAEEWIMSVFSALAFVAGAMEWHGQAQLREGNIGGLPWLLGAQGCLYTVIAGYVLWRLQFFDGSQYWAQIPEEMREQLNEKMRIQGLDPEADRPLLLRTMNFLICSVLIFVSTLYQGGLTWWYRRQRDAIAAALGY